MKKLLLLTALLSFYQVSAKFVNSGTFQSKNSQLSADILVNNGNIIGIDKVEITADELQGNGTIKGPIITILVKKHFNFRGIIECDKECVVRTSQKVDRRLFTTKGKGKFTFESIKEETKK